MISKWIDIRNGIIYNTTMGVHQIVLDTNVFVTALRSKRGASYKLLSLIDSQMYQINLSVPLVIEYEAITKRQADELELTTHEIDDIIDYLVLLANRWQIHYLWRPQLNDPNDDMLLELAVTANCKFIITYNLQDFKGVEKFNVEVVTPKDFLRIIGE